MLLETFQAKLSQQGRSEEEIDEITFQLSQRFPEMFLQYELKAMSAGMDAINLPDKVVAEYVELDDSEMDPRRNVARAGPFYFKVTDEEKEEIRNEILANAASAAGDAPFLKKLNAMLDDREGEVRLTIPDSNSKLGKLQNFSLPVGQPERAGSCIGASKECESVCYLTGGFVIDEKTGKERAAQLGYLGNQVPYHINYAIVRLFPDRWIKAMEKYIVDKVFRIHVGGDFFSAEYVRTWIELAKVRSDVRFFAYTRSWQDGFGNLRDEMIPALTEFAETENCRLLLSCDEDTGVPRVDLVPAAIRAWMAVNDNVPPTPPELIFRDKSHLKRKILSYNTTTRMMLQGKGDPKKQEERLANIKTEMQKNVRGFFVVKSQRVPVCPIEVNPLYIKKSGELNCQTCGWCFSFLHAAHGAREEDDVAMIEKYTGKKPEKIIRILRKFKRTASNPPVCVTCYGDCECGKCGCESCVIHDVDICCCGCMPGAEEELYNPEEEEECACVEACEHDPCDCGACGACELCQCCCIC